MPPKPRAKRAATADPDGQPDTKKAKGKGKGQVKAEPIADDDGAATSEPDKQPPKKEVVKEAQLASDSTRVPLDEGCPLTSYRVWIDDDGLIYDAALNQTNAGANNNKFYKIQLLHNGCDFKTWTRWGRVGERGQSAVLGGGSVDEALREFNKKFKDKSGLNWENRNEPSKPKKYVFVERSYEPDDEDEDEASTKPGASRERSEYSPPKCTLASPVKSLMELIFNQQYIDATMAALNYDSKKMPLGKLSKATITRGYQALKELAELLDDPDADKPDGLSHAQAIEHFSNQYYSTIPHSFGRNRPPIIQNEELLKREIDLLESLTDMKDADLIMKKEKNTEDVHPLDSRFKALGLEEMDPLDHKSDEFAGICEYLLQTRGSTHSFNYEVLDVFRIQRAGEEERFAKSEYAKIGSDRRLLWHGSRATNYGGILGQGLRIAPPEAPVSGYMFDKGIYLADMSSKSANYCASYISGGHALLLLCEAELGDPMQVLTNAQYDAGSTAKAKGLHSTWGQGSTGPVGWKDAKCLHKSLAGVKMPDTTNPPGRTDVASIATLFYNEYICYDVAQVRLRYLLRVRM